MDIEIKKATEAGRGLVTAGAHTAQLVKEGTPQPAKNRTCECTRSNLNDVNLSKGALCA